MIVWPFFLVTAGVAFLLTGVLRRYVLSRGLLDFPGRRSSHTAPTPRGGGLAIAASFLLAILLLGVLNEYQHSLIIALVCAGAWIALVGFWDDHGDVAPRWRLLAHFVGASWVLVWLGGLPPLRIWGYLIDFGMVGHLVAAVYLAWLLNLYNFMDGIDGIATIEAITVCIGSALVARFVVNDQVLWAPPLLLACAACGFLYWNFPKARIFMGDSGSGFLGIIIGGFSLLHAWIAPQLFWVWQILLGAFIVDTTVTLFRRILRGEKIYKAHRSHAYQYASRKYSSHMVVSLAVGAINLFWLLPLALAVGLGWLDGVVGVIIAYLPLIGLAIYYKAGAAEKQKL